MVGKEGVAEAFLGACRYHHHLHHHHRDDHHIIIILIIIPITINIIVFPMIVGAASLLAFNRFLPAYRYSSSFPLFAGKYFASYSKNQGPWDPGEGRWKHRADVGFQRRSLANNLSLTFDNFPALFFYFLSSLLFLFYTLSLFFQVTCRLSLCFFCTEPISMLPTSESNFVPCNLSGPPSSYLCCCQLSFFWALVL